MPRAPQPRSGKLSRERIVEAALAVVEKDGLESLSMRRLAQELDVWPMSVYRYFRDKDELLDAVVDGAAEEVALPEVGGGGWREQILDLLHEARAALGREPAGLSTLFTRAMLTPGALRISEAGLRILQDAGFEPGEAARAWRALCGYAFGASGFEDDASSEAAVRRARSALAGLSADEFPALTTAGDGFARALASREALEYGLERLLDGLEARLGEAARA